MVPARLKRKLASVEARDIGRGRQTGKRARASATMKKRKVTKRTTKSGSKAKASAARSTAKKKGSTAGVTTKTAATSRVSGSGKHLRCKVEFSPNARAKCRLCDERIEKQEQRVGVSSELLSTTTPNYRYYHLRCCPEHVRKIILPQLSREEQHSLLRNTMILQRTHLLNELIENWSLLGNRIDNLVIALPRNRSELCRILGSDQPSFPYRGREDQLLDVIRRFVEERGYQHPTAGSSTGKDPSSQRVGANSNSSHRTNDHAEIIVIDDTDDEDEEDVGVNRTGGGTKGGDALAQEHGDEAIDENDEDDEISVGETLTCAQVIQQRFDLAAAHGEIVDID
eukprot:jgi/Psemu1/35207/gm1.35207_g